MIPIKERPSFKSSILRFAGQFATLFILYIGGGFLLMKHLVENQLSVSSEFWMSLANHVDTQKLQPNLNINEVEGFSLMDLYETDLALYGVTLYKDFAFPIILVGLLLLFVLVAAIILCDDREI
jgi:hypothetical protein